MDLEVKETSALWSFNQNSRSRVQEKPSIVIDLDSYRLSCPIGMIDKPQSYWACFLVLPVLLYGDFAFHATSVGWRSNVVLFL